MGALLESNPSKVDATRVLAEEFKQRVPHRTGVFRSVTLAQTSYEGQRATSPSNAPARADTPEQAHP